MGIKDIINKFKAKFSNDPNQPPNQDRYLESLRRQKQKILEREEKIQLKKEIADDQKQQTNEHLYGIPPKLQKWAEKKDKEAGVQQPRVIQGNEEKIMNQLRSRMDIERQKSQQTELQQIKNIAKSITKGKYAALQKGLRGKSVSQKMQNKVLKAQIRMAKLRQKSQQRVTQQMQPQQRTILSDTGAFFNQNSGFMAQQQQRPVNVLANEVNILRSPNLITSKQNKQQFRSKWI